MTLDLQALNILLRIEDETVLKDAEEAEIEDPSPRKITEEESVVFEGRALPGPLRRWIGAKSSPVLCDFGEARTGKDSYAEHTQPALYRAPEVFLHLPWGTPVDIWNPGCMVRGYHCLFPHVVIDRYGASCLVDTFFPGKVRQMRRLPTKTSSRGCLLCLDRPQKRF